MTEVRSYDQTIILRIFDRSFNQQDRSYEGFHVLPIEHSLGDGIGVSFYPRWIIEDLSR